MQGFISQIAEELYEKYGDEISSLNILFPSRRARLFFADALSRISDKPLWQPNYVSIDEMMQQISRLTASDPVRLITELYKVYSRHHDEPFDSFYFWGEMLLADFDSIDKYLIDAKMLFANVADLKSMENDMSYLTDEQISVIKQFWSSFSIQSGFSREQEQFIKIWESLAPVYSDFRAVLSGQQMAYTGMMHRIAVEKIISGEAPRLDGQRYIVAGFNALTECEKKLLDHLSRSYDTEFYWDYDSYYVDNQQQEAGLFLRENIRHFPQKQTLGRIDNFVQQKEIVVVSAPSDTMQCRYVHDFLQELVDGGQIPDKETTVVLTDENLLMPVLYSIPESVENVNITMGYPLRQTLAYSFMERLIELQNRRRMSARKTTTDGVSAGVGASAANGQPAVASASRTSFYHSDVTGLLTHPFVVENCAAIAQRLADEIVKRGQVYVDSKRLTGNSLIDLVFKTPDSWQQLSEYLLEVLSAVAQLSKDGDDAAQRMEFFTLIADHIYKLRNSLNDCGVEVSVSIFASLLRRTLQTLRIPYEGEPLLGVQVMGILETRNLDFENVVVLSMADDTFPGNRSASSSFIPYNLRMAYGLPTPMHHEGVYAYYFYRLLQRARKIHLVYSSQSDDKQTGEPSRYIYQLKYESPHQLVEKRLALDVNLAQSSAIVVEKSGEVRERLAQYLDNSDKRLSPTSFYAYVECPLKFYFRAVAAIKKEDELAEQIDSPMFGTILHRAMELLYADLVGVVRPQQAIGKLIGSDRVDSAVVAAIGDEYLKGEQMDASEYGGNLLLIRDIVAKYINTCLLPYDAADNNFMISELEKRIEASFSIECEDGSHRVWFGGMADRIDLLHDGTTRVVDYKTGSQHIEFKGVDALFSQNSKERSSAVLQTLLYAMMINTETGNDVQPALYYVRNINAEDYSPLLMDKSRNGHVNRYLDYKNEFEQRLKDSLEELFDSNRPFVQCEDSAPCAWCDYREICRR